MARCIAGEYRRGNMRFTNPDRALRLRSATSRATLGWSGFGVCSSNGSLLSRSTKQAHAAKIGLLKSPDACKSLSLLVCIPASSIRLKRGFPTLLRDRGGYEPTGVSGNGDEQRNLGIEVCVS